MSTAPCPLTPLLLQPVILYSLTPGLLHSSPSAWPKPPTVWLSSSTSSWRTVLIFLPRSYYLTPHPHFLCH